MQTLGLDESQKSQCKSPILKSVVVHPVSLLVVGEEDARYLGTL